MVVRRKKDIQAMSYPRLRSEWTVLTNATVNILPQKESEMTSCCREIVRMHLARKRECQNGCCCLRPSEQGENENSQSNDPGEDIDSPNTF